VSTVTKFCRLAPKLSWNTQDDGSIINQLVYAPHALRHKLITIAARLDSGLGAPESKALCPTPFIVFATTAFCQKKIG